MLTARGWWLLFWMALLCIVGVVGFAFSAPVVAILAFTFLLAILGEWILFLARVRLVSRKWVVERKILGIDREMPTLWAGTVCTVQVRLSLDGGTRLPFLIASDYIPPGQVIHSGRRRVNSSLEPHEELVWEYSLKPEMPGVIRFEGVEVRIADLCGFFYHRWFLRAPVEYLILPPLVNDEGQRRAVKRFNTLPPPGIHRLRRPGGGSELLDLRDYRPGDPPKMIAWKASARRDRLITKEFENDIPVRMVLFLDASATTRIGKPGATPLARTCAVAAGLAQAASANRDLVGLCVFDENRSERIKPARTQIHTMKMLRVLAETAGRLPDNAQSDPALSQKIAFSLAQELYPELLNKKINTTPNGLFWFPLLDTRLGWLLIIPLLLQALMINLGVVNELVGIARDIVRPRGSLWTLIPLVLVFGVLFYLPMIITGAFWFLHGIRGFFAPHKKRIDRRKRLATVLASLDQDEPAAIERLLHDDGEMNHRCQKFLTDHRIALPPTLFNERGEYRFLGVEKLQILADSLVRSVGTARDNELYVILADLVELEQELDQIKRAIRAARARHHQVIIILHWPENMPPPVTGEAAPKKSSSKKKGTLKLSQVITTGLIESYHAQFLRVRLELIRSGADVIRSSPDDTVALILQRLEQLRHGRIRR